MVSKGGWDLATVSFVLIAFSGFSLVFYAAELGDWSSAPALIGGLASAFGMLGAVVSVIQGREALAYQGVPALRVPGPFRNCARCGTYYDAGAGPCPRCGAAY